jgi:hypothetical protein
LELRLEDDLDQGGRRHTSDTLAYSLGGGDNVGSSSVQRRQKRTVRERSRETVRDSDGGMTSLLGHDSEAKGCKDKGDCMWLMAAVVLKPPARGRAAVARTRPATGRHLSGA